MFEQREIIHEMDGLKKFAYKLTSTREDAEDLLQSTLTKALEKKHLFKDNTDLFKWSSKIMYNIFASQYRRKVKFESQYDPEPVVDRQSSQPLQDLKHHSRQVRESIDKMNPDHKKVVVEIALKGKSYKSVAKKLGVPVGTVRSRLNRARSILHEELNDPANENDNPAYFATDERKAIAGQTHS